MKLYLKFALALLALTWGAARADLSFDAAISDPNQIDEYIFHVGSDGLGSLYTASNSPFDPYLTLWSTSSAAPTNSDWQLVASNDNRSTADFSETINSLDSKIDSFSFMAGLSYLAIVTESGNIPLGSLLSNGWSMGGTQDNGVSYDYTLNIVGNAVSGLAPAAVPLPAAVWMFGAGLMGLLGMAKRKGVSAV
jgi:hypothetical protein